MLVIATVACNKWDNSFAVNGDCKIDSLMLDTYAGVVDHAARTVVVGVPENHDDQLMTITHLSLSAGATANHKVGDQVNNQKRKQFMLQIFLQLFYVVLYLVTL